jgi:hypothetical protein
MDGYAIERSIFFKEKIYRQAEMRYKENPIINL